MTNAGEKYIPTIAIKQVLESFEHTTNKNGEYVFNAWQDVFYRGGEHCATVKGKVTVGFIGLWYNLHGKYDDPKSQETMGNCEEIGGFSINENDARWLEDRLENTYHIKRRRLTPEEALSEINRLAKELTAEEYYSSKRVKDLQSMIPSVNDKPKHEEKPKPIIGWLGEQLTLF